MATETVINRPAPFVEEIGKKLSSWSSFRLTKCSSCNNRYCRNSQDKFGETAEGFKARQDAAEHLH